MIETNKKQKKGINTKRADKKKNIAKVLREVINHPIQSQANIAIKTGLSVGSVNAQLKELEGSGIKMPEINDICNKDFEIMKMVQGITITRLQHQEKESFGDIIRAGAESTKRYTIFKGDVTNKDGGLKSFDVLKTMTLEELNEYKKNLFN